MSNCHKPVYRGPGLNSGLARAVRVVFTKCNPSKLPGAVSTDACTPTRGGTPSIKSPSFVLTVDNGLLNFPDCNIWQDDNEELVREGDGDIICIDNV